MASEELVGMNIDDVLRLDKTFILLNCSGSSSRRRA